jgi:uncharacterized protein
MSADYFDSSVVALPASYNRRFMLRQLMLTAAFCIALGLVAPLVAQEPAKAKKQHFLIMLKPGRAGFLEAPTPAEQKTVGEHFQYLKKLAADGKVVLAGPSINGDKTFGIVVLEVASEAEATALMQGDPSVRAGVMKGEVLPFTLSLMRSQ